MKRETLSTNNGIGRCDLCQTFRPFHCLFQKGGYQIRLCLECGLIYCSPLPTEEELAVLYSRDYYASDDSLLYAGYLADRDTLLMNSRHCLSGIEALKAPPGRLLDVGCAAGFFLEVARSRWQVRGLEISPYAVRHACEELGLDVIEGNVIAVDLPSESFDVITLWDTIEHLRQPCQALKILHSLLAENGLLALSTGDASSLLARLSLKRWRLMAPPYHLYYFTPHTITSLLQRTGFHLLGIEKIGKWFSVNSIVHGLGWRLPDRMEWLGNTRVYLNLRDVMTAYALKERPS